jgi:c(7)-type cytochrome triheme protein
MMRKTLLAAIVTIAVPAVFLPGAWGEYGDIPINNYSEKNGMRPVVFPHWFHRIRFRCSVCHDELGFAMKREANKIDMGKIADGKFCGACHNGQVAWAPIFCNRCHTGIPQQSAAKPHP